MKKITVIALSLLVMLVGFGGLQIESYAVDDSIIASGSTSLEVNSHTRTVGFAGQEWYVIGYNDGANVPSGVYTIHPQSATLLAKDNLYPPVTAWIGHTNGYYNSGLYDGITSISNNIYPKELSLINGRTLSAYDDGDFNFMESDTYDIVGNAPLENQKLWPISFTEHTAINDNEIRSYSMLYLLRAPITKGGSVFVAYSTGWYAPDGDEYATRPALNLDLSNAILTSAAENGKSDAVGADLSNTTNPAASIKYTMKTDDKEFLNLNVADKSALICAPGDTIEIAYTGALEAADKFVSCYITDNSSGDVKYYGKLATATSDTAKINIPEDLVDGQYKISIFNEQVNADYFTDFAGGVSEIPLTIDATYVPAPEDNLYMVIKHFGTYYGSGTISAQIDCNEDKFSHLLYKGNVVDESNYDITHGSTIITLTEDHARTYALGNHAFTAVFDDGVSEIINLTVADATTPATGDNIPLGVTIIVCIVALMGLCSLIAYKRRVYAPPRL